MTVMFRQRVMKPSQLRSLLSSLDSFEKPDVLLEQYATDADMAGLHRLTMFSHSTLEAETDCFSNMKTICSVDLVMRK